MDVQFTDRYEGVRKLSWLRMCFGRCEGMGLYPVWAHAPDHVTEGAMLRESYFLTPYEAREIALNHTHEEDGVYFVKCEACRGTGDVSWWTTLRRVPRWVLNGINCCRTMGPRSSAWNGHPFSYPRKAWLTFKVAFLCDLGMRM